MYYLLFDSTETSEQYEKLMANPNTHVKPQFPSGYCITDKDMADICMLNVNYMVLKGIYPS